ncbi:MAG: hypothetical protein ACXAEN_26820 [Candidatus Thorarchaeota archaeon]
MDLQGMNRKEKFKYLKANGVKCAATMKTVELDRLMNELDAFQRGEAEAAPEGLKSVREAHRRKLSVDHLNIPKNKAVRWVNDKSGRIPMAIEGGYQHVTDPDKRQVGEESLVTQDMGEAVSAVVGTDEAGRPITAYLMAIDKDLYDEDQDFKQRQLDELDDAISRGAVEPSEGQYVPSGGIKYQR